VAGTAGVFPYNRSVADLGGDIVARHDAVAQGGRGYLAFRARDQGVIELDG
jgi:hypothetical protein